MEHGSPGGMPMDQGSMPGMSHGSPSGAQQMNHGAMPSTGQGSPGGTEQMNHGSMPGMSHGTTGGMPAMTNMASQSAAADLEGSVGVDNVAMATSERLSEPGEGFPEGRRVLRYTDLRALKRGNDPRAPAREIVLHLTGNMDRFMWGFDGKKFSEAGPIELKRGERVRFTLINDTMMEHPMHLHGLWSELDNGHGEYRPYKHTIIVKPGERLSFLVNADEPGRWAFHCHLLYHMESGMFREVRVT
jgi:FtsP/CotA-like multicopper oxidase with cupredoxin domain